MDPGTEWPAATIQYRLNLPHALHSISPALSALHTSRAAALHPETSAVLRPSHCSKCGTYYFSGDHPSHLVGPSTRKKRSRTPSSHPKTLRRRCHVCGFSIDARTSPSTVPIQSPSDMSRTGSVPATPRIMEIVQEPPPSDILRPTAGTLPTTKCAPVPSHPKASHTKTSTLKDMLSRNRQREAVVKSHTKRKEGHDGLAAFLKAL
jgi:hypothetical protein